MVDQDIQLKFESNGCLISLSGELAIQYLHSYQTAALVRRVKDSNQALLKACSNKQKNIHNVLDITGGWGIDSFILATRKKSVTMVEQNPILVKANIHALKCLKESEQLTDITNRIQVTCADAFDYLSNNSEVINSDCIYMDPMFPDHKSSAKPGKEMQILQKLTSNQNLEQCFDTAIKLAKKRVVVKRPLKADPFNRLKPDFCYREKSVRFDVYLTA